MHLFLCDFNNGIRNGFLPSTKGFSNISWCFFLKQLTFPFNPDSQIKSTQSILLHTKPLIVITLQVPQLFQITATFVFAQSYHTKLLLLYLQRYYYYYAFEKSSLFFRRTCGHAKIMIERN